jgi:threonine dehydrogenase-like Zn-dependent dehydrogenase
MKAVVFDRPRTFDVRDVPTPDPGPGDVRVAMTIAGVCGTDVHIHDGTFFADFPLIPGHEPAGVVDEAGDGVESVRVGQRVDCFPRSIAMLRSGRVRTDGVITHRYRLDAFGDVIETIRSDARCLKAVLEIA